jgi:hypothetical protein
MGLFHSPSIVTDGLVLAVDAANSKSYPGTGSTWSDISGNGNDMSLISTTHNSSGYFDFNGSTSYAVASNNGLGTGADIPFTFEMWVNFDTMGSTRWWLAVIGQFGTGAHHVIGGEVTANTQFGIWSGAQNQFPLSVIGTGNWRHLVSTSTGSVLTTYVDAVQRDTDAATTYNFTNTNFTIGDNAVASEAYYDGKVAVAKLYNRALSASEVAQNYEALRGRFGL